MIYLNREYISKPETTLITIANIIILITVVAISHIHGKIGYQLEKKQQRLQNSLSTQPYE